MRLLRSFVTAAVVLTVALTPACVGIGLPGKPSIPTTTPTPAGPSSMPPGSSAAINHDFLKLSQTIPNAALEVATSDGRLLIGRFVSADVDGLTLKIDLRLETVKRDDIMHVSGYATQVVRYSLIGASFGALGGLFVVTSQPPGYGVRVSAMAAGAALGALAGAFTGSQYRQRIVIYERR
jgi:hypothetical protein